VAAAGLIATVFTAVSVAPQTPAEASPTQTRFFATTGHTVGGAFLGFFDANGGIRVFGLPLSDQVSENGRPVQYFERQRFEYHAESAGTQFEVQLSRLGADMVPGGATGPAAQGSAAGYYFPETHHTLSNYFLNYWRSNGGLRIFGFPITELVSENGLNVQYFERARMEYHPENASNGNTVLLGLLGKRFIEIHPDVSAALGSLNRAVSPVSRGEAPAQVSAPAQALSAKENDLLARINAVRASRGQPAVALDAKLREIALSRSRDMVARQYFSHTTPDGTDFMGMLKNAGISYKLCGEIIANNNYDDGQASLQAYNSFINSPHHAEILLDGRYNVAGIGEASDGKGYHYFTVIFIQR